MGIELIGADGKRQMGHRPSAAYRMGGAGGAWAYTCLQTALLEDIRNQLEELNRKQTLSCSVASDIRRVRLAVQRLARKKTRRQPRTRR